MAGIEVASGELMHEAQMPKASSGVMGYNLDFGPRDVERRLESTLKQLGYTVDGSSAEHGLSGYAAALKWVISCMKL